MEWTGITFITAVESHADIQQGQRLFSIRMLASRGLNTSNLPSACSPTASREIVAILVLSGGARSRRTRLSSTHFCQFALFWAYGSHGAEHAVRTASATDQWFRLPQVFWLLRRANCVPVMYALPGVVAVV